MKKQFMIIGYVTLLVIIGLSGCFNVPEELTQISIVSFDAEPNIINQGEYVNLSWIVLSADSVTINNGIGNVALTGHRTVQPLQTTTYILTASNETITKNATVTITVKSTMYTTISDEIGDVTSIDYRTGETNVIRNHQNINVNNLDLIRVTYTQLGSRVTISLQVKGNIENRGKIIDPYSDDFFSSLTTVEYDVILTTSVEDYSISYSNNSCRLVYGTQQINLTSADFSVVDDTLTISLFLISPTETYSELSVYSTYEYFVYNVEESFIELVSDVAPNPALAIREAYASNIGSVGESIQFNGSVEPLTGTPPYSYHWGFGDGSASTLQNPTHVYTKAGVFTYTFTVTDDAEVTASLSDSITILEEESIITPDMAWTKQTAPVKQLILVMADPGLHWEDFSITGDAHTTSFTEGSTESVIAGDTITLIPTTGTITVRHIPSNTLIGTWTWT